VTKERDDGREGPRAADGAAYGDGGGKKIWFGKEIPRKKLDGAIKAYANPVNPDSVIALHDSTIFGGGGEGFVVTEAAFYCKGFRGREAEIRFESIERIDTEELDLMCALKVVLKTGAQLPFLGAKEGDVQPIAPIRKFFERVLSLRDAGAVAVEDRFVIVQDMSEEFRVAYVKLAVFLALADDNEVDAGELAELRERMMQEVMKQLQRTVNALIEDLTMLTQDVVDLAQQSEIDQTRMRRLAREVNALTSALSRLTKRQQPPALLEALA
jgi:hypothetical protein